MTEQTETKIKKLSALKVNASLFAPESTGTNPWSYDSVDKLEFSEEYPETVDACRFFYSKDPIASSTINKMVEIGINDLYFDNSKLSENEMRVFESVKEKLVEFAEAMALEYLISGLVIPEVNYTTVLKEDLEEVGIKKYPTLILPTSMWLRDPKSIKIKPAVLSDKPAYFYKVPDNVVYFIEHKGKYPDGQVDEQLWIELQESFPEFITKVLNGDRYFLLDNKLIFSRKMITGSPYPTPYLYPALESMKHKRNLRRMDYSIAARVISAIQLFNLGNDEYPITEDNQEEQFDAVREQIYYRNSSNFDIERVFQLFANHTLKITWVFPDTDALLNEKKYVDVNEDIIFALGFPRILITGEASRAGTSDPQYAMMSPARTMINFRKRILTVIRNVVYNIAKKNKFKTSPEVNFKPLTLFDMEVLLKSLSDLYNTGNLSRTTYSDTLGYSWEDEMDLKESENKVLEEKKLEQFAPQPFSNQPGQPGMNNPGAKKPTNNPGTTTTKPSNVKKTSPNTDGAN